jgi:hypothetical protein
VKQQTPYEYCRCKSNLRPILIELEEYVAISSLIRVVLACPATVLAGAITDIIIESEYYLIQQTCTSPEMNKDLREIPRTVIARNVWLSVQLGVGTKETPKGEN